MQTVTWGWALAQFVPGIINSNLLIDMASIFASSLILPTHKKHAIFYSSTRTHLMRFGGERRDSILLQSSILIDFDIEIATDRGQRPAPAIYIVVAFTRYLVCIYYTWYMVHCCTRGGYGRHINLLIRG